MLRSSVKTGRRTQGSGRRHTRQLLVLIDDTIYPTQNQTSKIVLSTMIKRAFSKCP